MNLYINTSGEFCEIALFEKNKVKYHYVHTTAMEHSTVLHNLIQELLLKEKVSFNELTSISLLNGPGSYTGLRIGLAAAKGFCYALDIPLILFNKIGLSCAYYKSLHQDVNVLAYIEAARQGEYFFCLEQQQTVTCPPMVQHADFIIEQLRPFENMAVIGPEGSYFEDLQVHCESFLLSMDFISQEVSKRLENKQFDELYRSEPFYLKKVHANTPKKRF